MTTFATMSEPVFDPKAASARLLQLQQWSGLSKRGVDRLANGSEKGAGVFAIIVDRLANGEADSVRITTLERWARVFGSSVQWIAYGRGRKPSRAGVRRAVAALTSPATTEG